MAPPPSGFYGIVIPCDKIFKIYIIFNACFIIFSGSDTIISVKEFKSLASELGRDTSKCIEKWDQVSQLQNAKSDEVTKDPYEDAAIEEATLNQHE